MFPIFVVQNWVFPAHGFVEMSLAGLQRGFYMKDVYPERGNEFWRVAMCGFLCNFPDSVVTISRLPSLLVCVRV